MNKNRLGATGEGTHHFWQQRLTGLVNLFLGLACVSGLSFYGREQHSEVWLWLSSPWLVGGLLVFVLSALWHMRLGLHVIIDDYIPSEGSRLFLHIINTFAIVVAMVAVTLSLLQILLGGVS